MNVRMIHVRYDGRSYDLKAVEMNITDESNDQDVSMAVARFLEVGLDKLEAYVVERHRNGNITLRPEAVFGDSLDTSPMTTLSNGVVIANFSSPHTFKFVDGTVLPACSAERAQAMKLEAIEELSPNPYREDCVQDIRLDWCITDLIVKELEKLNALRVVNVILVPFPVMTALKNADMDIGKARVIRVADRVTKLIHTDGFCA